MARERDDDLTRQGDLILSAMVAASNEDAKAVSQIIMLLADEYGWIGLLRAMVCWIGIAQNHCGMDSGGGFFSMTGINGETGGLIDIEQTGASAGVIAAMRVFALVGNDDPDMAADVFFAAVEGGHGMEAVGAALGVAVSLMGPDLGGHLRAHE